MKKLFMVCNAHIDPVWLWKKQDGISAVLATFRSAANLLEKYDFIFCHNESFTYKVVEKYDPELFKRIQKLNKEGKWRIMGGWDIQPDCNMPSGESIIRHIEEGKRYFSEKFNEVPTVATNFDPFGHSDGLIQILAQCDFNGYVICRPNPEESNIPENFTWKKGDWQIKVSRPNEHYNSLRGEARKKAETIIANDTQDYKLMLWGVGNHGGGPSECDILDLKALSENSSIEIVYATPKEYFAQADFSIEHSGSLTPCMPGCYTVQSALKQRHKKLENELYFTEKMCSHAFAVSGKEYPEENLKKALDELLFSEFHDALPGSAVKIVEEQVMRSMDYALHIIENEKYDAFCALASKAVKAEKGEYPFFVYNPMPYTIKTPVTLDFILENQNWDKYFVDLDVFVNGEKVPSQIVKEKSNINLDWAKCVEIECVLPPSSLSRISVFERHIAKKNKIKQDFDENIIFDNGNLRVELNTLTGRIDGVWYKGKRVLEKNSFTIDVIGDNSDPWAMGENQRYQLGEKVDSFRLIEKSLLDGYIKGSNSSGKNLRIVENGDVLMRTEAIFAYGKSDAVMRFTFYKNHDYFDVDLSINNNDFDVTYKLSMGITEEGVLYGESMFGQEELSKKGSELVAHRWVRSEGESNAINVYSKDTYGYSFKRGVLSMNLLRSAAYSAHPLSGREFLPYDRVIERIDCGVKTFSFRIEPCKKEESLIKASRGAELFNAPCYLESFWPDGKEQNVVNSFITFDNQCVEMVSLRKYNDGYVMRVHNSNNADTKTIIKCSVLDVAYEMLLKAFEFKTYFISQKNIKEVDPIFFNEKK